MPDQPEVTAAASARVEALPTGRPAVDDRRTSQALAAFPRGVSDPHCPHGHVLKRTTSTDHRLLWHIETALAVSATNDTLRALGSDLRRYLNATCQHHWHRCEGDDDIPAHRQCLWCNYVIWLADEEVKRDG